MRRYNKTRYGNQLNNLECITSVRLLTHERHPPIPGTNGWTMGVFRKFFGETDQRHRECHVHIGHFPEQLSKLLRPQVNYKIHPGWKKIPVAQVVEHSAWIRRLWVRVPPGVNIFSLKTFFRKTHSSVDSGRCCCPFKNTQVKYQFCKQNIYLPILIGIYSAVGTRRHDFLPPPYKIIVTYI